MNKKLPVLILSVITAFSFSAATLTGCEEKCDHVFRWSVVEEATCSKNGLQQGVCGLCGEVIKEETEIEPDNHSYGEWEVEIPNGSTGKAVKTCAANSAHTYEVVLPALSDEQSYKSIKVTKGAGVLTEGIKTYVFADDFGDVTFNVPIAPRGIENVADAVEVGSTGKSQIRSVQGFTSSGMGNAIGYKFSYEYGDNYTHITDSADNVQMWCSLDENGKFWGYINMYGALANLTESSYIDGLRFTLGYTGYGAYFFGAEQLLEGMYSWGATSVNNDFYETIERDEEGTVYKFGFGYKHTSALYFSKITVTFTLTQSYAIKTLDVNSIVYINYATEPENNSWVQAEDGYYYVSNEEGAHYTDHIYLEQTLISELSEEEQTNVPVNPYVKDAFNIASYDLVYNGKVVGEEGITINADDLIYLDIVNIAPSTAKLDLDIISVYMVNGREEIKLEAGSHSWLGVTGWYNNAKYSSRSIGIRSWIAGELTIRLKSEKCTKDFKVNVIPIAPTSLSPAVYEYYDSGYIWNTSTKTTTVYVGQTLYFKAQAPQAQAAYADGRYNVTANPGTGITLEETVLNGEPVTKLVASTTGEFKLIMSSVLNEDLTCTFTVNVTATPSASGLFQGTYTGKLEYPRRGTTVDITFSSFDGSSGKIEVGFSNGTNEVLSFTYNQTDGTLTTAHTGGVDLGCVIAFSEDYKFVLTHPTGFGDITETVVLSRKVAEEQQ